MRSLRSPRTLASVLAALVAGGSTATSLHAQDSTASTVRGSGKWTANIITFTGMRGGAEIRVEPRGGKESRARLGVRAANLNEQIAWDIVAGSCGDDGRPVAAGAAFRTLVTRNDGTGDATATIPRLESGKRYYVRLFAPGEVPSDRTGFGCANLSEG